MRACRGRRLFGSGWGRRRGAREGGGTVSISRRARMPCKDPPINGTHPIRRLRDGPRALLLEQRDDVIPCDIMSVPHHRALGTTISVDKRCQELIAQLLVQMHGVADQVQGLARRRTHRLVRWGTELAWKRLPIERPTLGDVMHRVDRQRRRPDGRPARTIAALVTRA